jgi:hypothetical protein
MMKWCMNQRWIQKRITSLSVIKSPPWNAWDVMRSNHKAKLVESVKKILQNTTVIYVFFMTTSIRKNVFFIAINVESVVSVVKKLPFTAMFAIVVWTSACRIITSVNLNDLERIVQSVCLDYRIQRCLLHFWDADMLCTQSVWVNIRRLI